MIVIQDNETQQMLSRGYYTANTRSAFSKDLSKIRKKTFKNSRYFERKVGDSWSQKVMTGVTWI